MTGRGAGSGPGRARRPGPEPLPPLRAWQTTALDRFEASRATDFLAVATPGAGKTTFALEAARRALAAGAVKRVLVVTPTQHLKRQWARAADAFGLALEPDWSSRSALPADLHGLVVTYQQVASSKATLRRLAAHAFVVLDEVHHAADSRAWGDAIRLAFDGARHRLSLSGTPFRSDDHPIPFVRYEAEQAVPDYEYGYGDALADGKVVRPVYFPRINGQMEWTAPDGSHLSATFDDALDPTLSGQRLRTALSLRGEWLPAVLGQAHAQLEEIRRSDPAAAGMVIAIDQEHARGIAALLRARAGVIPTVALSDDPGASGRILRFARGDAPWIVAVRMVSEGVDMPRLRVGVYATSTTTDLFFRQAVGRLVRFTPGEENQDAFFFIPDDPRLRRSAGEIQEQRRHTLRAREDAREEAGTPVESTPEGVDSIVNLFEPISAVPLAADGSRLDPSLPLFAFASGSTPPPGAAAGSTPPPGAAAGTAAAAPASEPELSPRERRERLRERNAALVRELVHRKRLSHQSVNVALNQRAGIRKVTEATIAQLEKRIAAAEAWLRRK
jgi:superfamily II DNA or RNA helicase